MSLQKLASLGRALAGRNLISPAVNSRVIPNRQKSTVLVLPPREKCSTTEVVILSVIFSCSILFTPAWVVFHMKEYSAKVSQ